MIWDRGTLGSRGRSAPGLHQGPSRLHARRREAARRLASRAHARAAGREAGELAADQGRRRGGARRRRSGYPRGEAALGRERPLDRGDRRRQGQKRVWQSNRSVKDNVKAGATKAKRQSGARRKNSPRPPRRSPQAKNGRSQSQEIAAKKARAQAQGPQRAIARLRAAVAGDAAGRSRPAAPAGCTRSSSTAIASRRGSTTARSSCSPARVSTGRTSFPTSPTAVARASRRDRADRRRDRGRGERRREFLGAAGGAQAKGRDDRFVYYVFDLLHLDGRDLSGLPLIERKAALKRC